MPRLRGVGTAKRAGTSSSLRSGGRTVFNGQGTHGLLTVPAPHPVSQGVPFIHAGDDLLRSKSLDRDSYNSGGWGEGVRGLWDVEKSALGARQGARKRALDARRDTCLRGRTGAGVEV